MFDSLFLTLKLIFLVTMGTSFLGAVLVWSLRGSSSVFSVLVGLPLVFSTLIYSFIFLSIFDFLSLYQIRSLWGLALLLTLNLTPYMFFALQLGYQSFPKSLRESLALCPDLSLYKKMKVYAVFLFPYWGVAFGLLSLEVLSEFGASFLFGQETLSVYVYNLWLEQYSFSKASFGFFLLLNLVVVFFGVSLYFQKNRRVSVSQKNKKVKSSPKRFVSLVYVLASVALPLSFLFMLSLDSWKSFDFEKATSSFLLSFAVAFVAFFVFVVLNGGSLFPRKSYLKYPGIFYGVPGVLIGMAFYFLNFKIGLLALLLSLTLKYYKFLVDHLFAAWQSTSSSALYARENIPSKKNQWKVDFLMSFHFLGISFALIVVEVLKELPLTLMLKPINFSTLSTEIFTLVSEGDWELAAPYALVIFIFGFCALLVNQYFEARMRRA